MTTTPTSTTPTSAPSENEPFHFTPPFSIQEGNSEILSNSFKAYVYRLNMGMKTIYSPPFSTPTIPLGVPLTPQEVPSPVPPPSRNLPISPFPFTVRVPQTHPSNPPARSASDFKCKWADCQMSFSTRTGLATHCSSHIFVEGFDDISSNPAVCLWNDCMEQFPTLKKLTKHLSHESHIGQTPFLSKQQEHQVSKKRKKYLCSFPGCNKSFTDSSNRKKHENTHNANRERFHCTEPGCTKSYTKRADLKVHLKIHRGEFPHRCSHPNCKKAFVRISELYTHERIHDNMRPHACPYCGKSFSETSRLKKHMVIHQEAKEVPEVNEAVVAFHHALQTAPNTILS